VLSLFGSIIFQLVRYFMLGDENCPLCIGMLCVVDCCTYVVTVRYSICIKTTGKKKKDFQQKGAESSAMSEFTLKNVFVMSHICHKRLSVDGCLIV